jgi:hypothetical protein
MVHFFGIFEPLFGERTVAPEAPHKTGFFGGTPEALVEDNEDEVVAAQDTADLIEAASERPHAFVMRYSF